MIDDDGQSLTDMAAVRFPLPLHSLQHAVDPKNAGIRMPASEGRW